MRSAVTVVQAIVAAAVWNVALLLLCL